MIHVHEASFKRIHKGNVHQHQLWSCTHVHLQTPIQNNDLRHQIASEELQNHRNYTLKNAGLF